MIPSIIYALGEDMIKYEKICRYCEKNLKDAVTNRTYCSEDCRFWNKVSKSSDENGCWVWTGFLNKWGYGTFPNEEYSDLAHRYIYQKTNGDISKELLVCHKCDNPACVRIDHLFLGTPKENSDDCNYKNRSGKKLSLECIQNIRDDQRIYRDIAQDYNIGRASISRIKCGVDWKHVEGELDKRGKVRGENIGSAKLTEEKVLAIRVDKRTHKQIAEAFKISERQVYCVKSGKYWKHVLGPLDIRGRGNYPRVIKTVEGSYAT